MSQHSSYNPKRKRRYGPKPNTRRARGLRRRDAGKKKGPRASKVQDVLPQVETDYAVEEAMLPTNQRTLKKYIRIYNWYVGKYQLYYDREICLEATSQAFKCRVETVEKAIACCKYILAVAQISNKQQNN